MRKQEALEIAVALHQAGARTATCHVDLANSWEIQYQHCPPARMIIIASLAQLAEQFHCRTPCPECGG